MSELLEYKCPCCGGAISFDSSIQKMKCPYCDTEFDMETLASYDASLNNGKTDSMDWDTEQGEEWREDGQMRVYVCDSCGGEIIADETTAATSCPFCGNPVVMKGNLSGVLKPDLVLPFKLDKKAAKEGLLRHVSGKKLLPKVFRDENHIDEIKGIYVPFWLFSMDANAQMRFRGQVVRTWSDSRYIHTETSYYALTRDGSVSYRNVPVDGSSKMPDDLMESIEPYDYSEAVDFQTAYLSGYFADKYDVTAEESVERANERIRETTEKEIRDETCGGFSSVTLEKSTMQFSDNQIKYALLPVWILNTTWKDKNYCFAMNGQTGKFVGDLPVDTAAYWKYFGLFAAIFTAAAYGVVTLLQFL